MNLFDKPQGKGADAPFFYFIVPAGIGYTAAQAGLFW